MTATAPDADDFDALAERLAFDCPRSLLTGLHARYTEPHRHYHTWAHVLACFDAKEQLADAASPAVDLALLYHDAIYEPLAHDNEARSAELLLGEGQKAWLDPRLLERAAPLVLATKHGGEALDSEDAALVLDADLSILGADEATFAAYERHVREEFREVPEALYTQGRSRILRAFLTRPTLYLTRRGQTLWEGAARKNLEESLRRLVSSPPWRSRST